MHLSIAEDGKFRVCIIVFLTGGTNGKISARNLNGADLFSLRIVVGCVDEHDRSVISGLRSVFVSVRIVWTSDGETPSNDDRGEIISLLVIRICDDLESVKDDSVGNTEGSLRCVLEIVELLKIGAREAVELEILELEILEIGGLETVELDILEIGGLEIDELETVELEIVELDILEIGGLENVELEIVELDFELGIIGNESVRLFDICSIKKSIFVSNEFLSVFKSSLSFSRSFVFFSNNALVFVTSLCTLYIDSTPSSIYSLLFCCFLFRLDMAAYRLQFFFRRCKYRTCQTTTPNSMLLVQEPYPYHFPS